MPSAENAQWNVEAGQELHDTAALTDSGDHKKFTGSEGKWSSAKGKQYTVLVNGIRNGFEITPKTGTNNAVTVAAGQLNLNGAIVDVAGADITGLTRPSGTGGADSIKISITVNVSAALADVDGTEHTAFSSTRAAAGGPPLIAVDSVEIGQVWLGATADAEVQESEIFQVPGEHQERADTPLSTVDAYNGAVNFVGVLPLIHTGPTARKTFAKFYTPIFLEIPNANNMQVPGKSKTTNSTAVYKAAIGSVASTLQAGSVTVLVDNGVNDFVVKAADDGLLWHEFYPDANASQKHIGQAHVGVTTSYPADNNISTAVTLSPEKEWIRIE